MNVRIVKVDELQFLICLKNGVWASNFNSFKKWLSGDKIVFSVEKRFAASATVLGNYHYDDEFLWDNGLFPHRIKISFDYIVPKDKRIEVSDMKELLINSWGKNYGWGIQNQTPLKPEDGFKLLEEVSSFDELGNFTDHIDTLIDQAKKERFEEEELITSGKMKTKDRRYKPSIIEF